MKDIVTAAVAAAQEAGDFLLHNFGKISKIERKKDQSLATNFDKEAEAMIVKRIKAKFSSHGIIGEEGGNSHIERDYLWIIDPLDGTHNFIRGINIFGVSIGVVHKGKFVAGVIYMPQEKEMYVGEQGNGAFKNNKKISVSKTKKLAECSISFDSSIRYSPPVMIATLNDLAPKVFNVRMLGSSARVLAYIAEGKLDLAVEFHDRPWDFAGGVAIIEAAGGKAVSINNRPLTYKDIGYIVANPFVFEAAKDIVFKAIEEYKRNKKK